MKGKLKTALMFCVGAFSILVGFTDVQAATLVRETVPNVFYARSGGGKPYGTSFVENYTMDGKTVYCIEPGVAITTSLYNGNVGWVGSPFSDEINQKMQLIGYYGYDYPGHHTQRFRLATQSLIWEVASGQKIELWTEIGGYGDYINVDYERNEIMKLVNSHYQVPSFNNEFKTGIVGQPITFTDTSGVLSNYEIYVSDGASSSIDGNTLTVIPNNVGEISVSLVRKLYTDDPTTIFVGIDNKSQKMGFFGIDDPVVASVKMNVLGGRVEIVKTDEDTGTTTPSGQQTSLAGAVYGVFDLNDNLITKLTTDNNSYAVSDYLPGLNVYYLKELSAPKGYNLDESKHYFKLDSENLLVRVNVSDKVIERSYEITKVVASSETVIMTPEVSVDFGIYDVNNNLISKLTSDSEGKIYFTLPYGDYILRQLSTIPGYEMMDDYSFSIKENGPTINKVFSNAEITSRVKVVKIDESGNVITKAGIKFKIKDIKSGEYVCQKISYPNETICEYETSSNGILITPYPLNSGSYQLEEQDQAIDGYLWNSTPLKFNIDENSNIVSSDGFDAVLELRFTNKEVKGAIEINKTGEKLVIENGTYSYKEIPLSNVKFEVYDESGKVVGTMTTNSSGYAKLDNLKLQKYTLKEISSSLDNMIDDTIYEVELKYKDQYTPVIVKSLSIKNYLPKGTLEFSKVDFSTSDPLPNTKIEIYTEDDKLIGSYITDNKGMVVIKDLPIINGKRYYILEKEAPSSYVLNTDKMWFKISENGEIVKSTMTNEKIKGNVEFLKIDSETGNPLANAKIEIYNADTDELVVSSVSGNDGRIVFENIEYGRYYLIESEAPNSYVRVSDKIYFDIVNHKEVITITMKNDKIKGNVEFLKIDSETGEPLANTKIEIYNADTDELVFSGVSGSDGRIVFENIEYGSYYLIESEAPNSYVMSDERKYFNILINNEVISITMDNDKITGTLEFLKVDSKTGAPLANAKIEIYNADNDVLVFSGVSGNDGRIVFENIKYGRYYLIESEAPEFYIRSDEKTYFDIVSNLETITITMDNEKVEMPKTFNTKLTSNIIIISTALLGIGILIYEKKKRK